MAVRSTRRAFLRAVGVGAAASLGLLAGCGAPPATPPPGRVYRVGLLGGRSGTERSEPFWQHLAELGYVEGRNLARAVRSFEDGQGVGPRNAQAAELVDLPVDVVVAVGPAAVRAAANTTSVIPVLMMGSNSDPIELGVAQSLARPGGNVTGVVGARSELGLKRLQLLAEAAPGMTRVLVLYGSLGQAGLREPEMETAAATLGIGYLGLRLAPSTAPEVVEAAIAQAVAEGADGLLLAEGPFANAHADRIIALAARHGLPAVHGMRREEVVRGALMAYVARESAIYQMAAQYVARLLQGEQASDLPIQLPMYYDLIVNLRTARTLGLTLSPGFLARVDELIE
jgi:putative ABC transport system substrate-binding protein